MTRRMNQAGLNLIKKYEGLELKAYEDIAGYQTIGYGHKIDVHDYESYPDGITEQQANDLLSIDLIKAENIVDEIIKVVLNDNQFSALVSLVFNLGIAPLNMTLGHLLNQGKYDQAANEILLWCHAKIDGVETVVKGLVERRQAEYNLFKTLIE